MMKNIGIYLHIPFCKKKCYYCDFVSYCNEENNINTYIECMQKEIEFKALELNKFSENNNEQFEIDTIYIGGGTPSFIDSKYILKLISSVKKYFNVIKNCEITIEVNPDSVSQEKLIEYKKIGINRISIGLQSTKNKLLEEIGRVHNFEQFKNSYNNIKNVGFNNINVDLMIALPNQTLEDVKESLVEVINLKPTHISVYSLILEEKTKLFKKVQNGNLKLPEEDVERKMYWYVKETLEKEGFPQYEISNFSKLGKESKHNLNCWNQESYIGCGVAAHSYFQGIRFSNIENIKKYISNYKCGDSVHNIIFHEHQDKAAMMKEYMLLGLRKVDGVNITEFKNKFSENPVYVFRNELNKLVSEGLLEIDENHVKLTAKGLDLANQVWLEFV